MLQGFVWLHQAAVSLAEREMDRGDILGAPVLVEHGCSHLDHLVELPDCAQVLELAQLCLAFGQRDGGVLGQEELDRLSRLTGDLLQGLHRRPGAALLDEVDGSPCELAARDLSQRQLGFPAGLFDGAFPYGDAFAAAAVPGAEHGGECTAAPGRRLLN